MKRNRNINGQQLIALSKMLQFLGQNTNPVTQFYGISHLAKESL